MKQSSVIVVVYGLIILIGGVMGHVKAASTASLVVGILFGALLISSAYGIYKGSLKAAIAALILGVMLDAFFTYRFMVTQKFMPAGALSVLSLIYILSIALLLRKSTLAQKR